MLINEITPSVDNTKWLKRLDTHLNEPTNKKLIKIPKVFKHQTRKSYKNSGASAINNPMSSPSLKICTQIHKLTVDKCKTYTHK